MARTNRCKHLLNNPTNNQNIIKRTPPVKEKNGLRLTHYIFTFAEPFVVLVCRDAPVELAKSIPIAPLDTLEFESITTSTFMTFVNDVSYDPVDQKVYFTSFTDGIKRINLDGTNEEQIGPMGKSDQGYQDWIRLKEKKIIDIAKY